MKLPLDETRDRWEEDENPVTGPAFEPDRIDWVTLHYPYMSRVPTPKWYAATLRAMQRDWLRRGYSLGYNVVVFPCGQVWEIRGTEFRCAANGIQTFETNHTSLAILLIVAGDDPATDEQVRAVRKIVASVRVHRAAKINLHYHVRSTSCPGEGIKEQFCAGVFEPVADPESEDEMTRLLWKDERYADTFLVFPAVTPLAPQLATRHQDEDAELIVERHSGVLKSLCAMTGLTKVTREDTRRLVDVSTLKDGEN